MNICWSSVGANIYDLLNNMNMVVIVRPLSCDIFLGGMQTESYHISTNKLK